MHQNAQPILVFDLETINDLELFFKTLDFSAKQKLLKTCNLYNVKEEHNEYDLDNIVQGICSKLPVQLQEREQNLIESLNAAINLKRRDEANVEFQKAHFHKIVAISVIFKAEDKLEILSLGDTRYTAKNSDIYEEKLIRQFFSSINKYKPILVSWNGQNFDLPVLHYRALKHGVPSQVYWQDGNYGNTYLNRYKNLHFDMMDYLALYNQRNFASLNDMAALINLPGKMDIDGSKVQNLYYKNQLIKIRNYCELDVLNTYLIYLRLELVRGNLKSECYNEYIKEVHFRLESSAKDHLQKYINYWNMDKSLV